MKTIMYRLDKPYNPTHYTNPNNFQMVNFPEMWQFANVNGMITYKYKVSTNGRVFSLISNRYVFGTTISNGYTMIEMVTEQEKVTISLHRLIMMTFAPVSNMNELDVNHIDGKRYNNFYYNLEWLTSKLNAIHASKFEHNSFTIEESVKVCELREQGYNTKEISEQMGWDYKEYNHTLKNIIYNNRDNYNFPPIEHKYSTKFTEDDVRNICKLREQKMDINDIIKKLGFENNVRTKDRMRAIFNKKKWVNISKDYNIEQYKDQNKFSNEQIEEICRMLFVDNKSIKDVIIHLGYEYNCKSSLYKVIQTISCRKNFKNISDKYINQE